MKVGYYPGCSLEGTARDYADSIEGICASFDIELEELSDWNCCGATAAHSIDHQGSIQLAGRNLELASQMPYRDLLVPCPMCFNRLKAAALALQGEEKERYPIQVTGHLPKIWDLANFFSTGEILEKMAKQIKKPLEGLKAVCYYGCMASRPPEVTEATDCEDPQSMDRILQTLGGTPIPWPYKTDCCGASLVISRPDMVYKLVGKLYDMAERVGAQAIVVSCQMCQANLDMYKEKVEAEWGREFSFPVFYFSDLIGLACDLSGVEKWLSRHFIDPFPLLRELGLWNGE